MTDTNLAERIEALEGRLENLGWLDVYDEHGVFVGTAPEHSETLSLLRDICALLRNQEATNG